MRGAETSITSSRRIQIPGIFEQEFTGLLSTVIRENPGAGVEVSGVLGYPCAPGIGTTINLPTSTTAKQKSFSWSWLFRSAKADWNIKS